MTASSADSQGRSAAQERYDLSSTEWAEWPNSELANAVIFAARGHVNVYSDQRATRARGLLAARHGIEPDQIVLGNGAADLIQTALLTLLSRGDELLIPWPSFGLYPRMAKWAGADARAVPLSRGQIDPGALLAALSERSRAIVICNPNDPTGAYIDSQALAGLLCELPDRVHVLLDEALVHFQDREDEDACLRLVERFSRLLVFRSFSNAYGLADLRAGYAVGAPGAGSTLDALAPALGVPAPTRAAVEYAVERCDAELARRRRMVAEQRSRIHEALAKLPLEAPESQAHFIWLRAEGMSGEQLFTALERNGIAAFPGAAVGDPDHVRLTLKSPAATERLLAVLPAIAASRAGDTSSPLEARPMAAAA